MLMTLYYTAPFPHQTRLLRCKLTKTGVLPGEPRSSSSSVPVHLRLFKMLRFLRFKTAAHKSLLFLNAKPKPPILPTVSTLNQFQVSHPGILFNTSLTFAPHVQQRGRGWGTMGIFYTQMELRASLQFLRHSHTVAFTRSTPALSLCRLNTAESMLRIFRFSSIIVQKVL